MKTPEVSTPSSEPMNDVAPGDPGWDAIDRRLADWESDPSQLADEDFEAPSAEIFALARQAVRRMRDEGKPAPQRVAPNGDGGFSFERRDGAIFEILELCADGSMELTVFENLRFRSRQRVS